MNVISRSDRGPLSLQPCSPPDANRGVSPQIDFSTRSVGLPGRESVSSHWKRLPRTFFDVASHSNSIISSCDHSEAGCYLFVPTMCEIINVSGRRLA